MTQTKLKIIKGCVLQQHTGQSKCINIFFVLFFKHVQKITFGKNWVDTTFFVIDRIIDPSFIVNTIGNEHHPIKRLI